MIRQGYPRLSLIFMKPVHPKKLRWTPIIQSVVAGSDLNIHLRGVHNPSDKAIDYKVAASNPDGIYFTHLRVPLGTVLVSK